MKAQHPAAVMLLRVLPPDHTYDEPTLKNRGCITVSLTGRKNTKWPLWGLPAMHINLTHDASFSVHFLPLIPPSQSARSLAGDTV